ncbi:MAG: hypothetical protein RL150_21 [Candidatus Parcubacteria bacterium]
MVALSMLGPWFMAKIIDSLTQERPITEAFQYLGGLLISGSLVVILTFVEYIHQVRYLDWQRSNALLDRMMRHLLSLTVGQLKSEHSGVTLSKVSRGQSAVRQLFDGIVQQLLPTLLFVFVACLAMLVAYPLVGIATTLCCICMLLYGVYVAKRTDKTRKKMSKYENSRVDPPNTDLARHMPSIMLAGESEPAMDRLNAVRRAAARNHRGFYVPLAWLTFPLWFGDLITRVGIVGLTIWCIKQGEYQIGALIAIWTWLMQSVGRLREMHHLLRNMLQLWADSEVFFEIKDIKPSFETPPHAVVLDEIQGDIVFDGVVFRHEGSHEPALSGVSFSIPAGSTVGIVGPSGAGKSTILSLLLGAVQPEMGRILVDGIDMRDIDLETFRSDVGYVEQEPLVFDWSLRDNLLFGLSDERRKTLCEDPEYTEMQRVLDSVGLSYMKPRLFDKMGEVGRKLSGGEKQRVAIARVALKNPALLVVDEGTSAVDPTTEKMVHQLLHEMSPGSTRIFVAHRLATVQDADLILVLEDGILVASGTHAELLDRCSLYHELVKGQLLRTGV